MGDNPSVSTNLDLVRSIYVHVERGELSVARWADPEIEWVNADGPEPCTLVGVAEMEQGLSADLDVWDDYRVEVDEIRELDDERLLVLIRRSGRGKASGLELGHTRMHGATLLHIRGGKVTRLVNYYDRDHAFAVLGLTPDTGS